MDFEDVNRSVDNPKLAQMYENLTSLTKQLAVLQGFIESKFGSEFTKFCQLSGRTSSIDHQNYSPGAHDSIDQEDGDYDKMPNLVSQESPSRTLGYVTVPLRQTGGTIPTPKLHPAPGSNSNSGQGKRDRSKDGSLQNVTENDDIMYPLHILPDLLEENNEEMDTSETPEFLELELDPTVLLRGEPPALPMFADASEEGSQNSIGDNPLIHTKRTSISNQSGSTTRFELEESSRGNNNMSRRASVGGHEGHLSRKKFDCLVCGIKFEFAETLKSHMDSHAGIRNIRSNSEDQQGGGNNANAPPLPKLMPRPSIPTPSDLSPVSLKIESPGSESDDPKSKPSRTKKISTAPIASSPSTSGSSKLASALKRRKRYNQTRPSSLECPECGLKIRDKSRLIEHLRGHTGERPFQCEICDKSYTRRDVLKTHILKMHGEVAQYHAS